MTDLTIIVPAQPGDRMPRVAAYARVSRDSDQLQHSLSAQVSHYRQLIQENREWEFAGVYVDEGITGTSIDGRKAFRRMLADCEHGRIDLILTKSISRFARNTVDLLETVRKLRDLGVEVRFEKENIHTLSCEGELLLTILASFAEEESLSLSRNVKWAIGNKYRSGKVHSRQRTFGYRWEGDALVVIPEEAAAVRFVFLSYLYGVSVSGICRALERQGVRSVHGKTISRAAVNYMVQNEHYTGVLILQRSYNYRPRKERRNRGELPIYRLERHHDPIISRETFLAVQQVRAKRILAHRAGS